MSYLVALLAFAAVMIVLATLASVVVEAMNMAFGLRRQHFREFLLATFHHVIAPRTPIDPEHPPPDDAKAREAADAQAAADFVDALLANPATTSAEPAAGTQGSLAQAQSVASAGLNKLTGKAELTTLDTRQFIEQLARTAPGRRLATIVDEELRAMLGEVAHEFERLGQASSALFARRATSLAVLAAVIIAVTVNVDSIRVYGALARDTELAERVVDKLNVEVLVDTSTGAPAANLSVDESKQQIAEATRVIRATALELASLGLPIGNRYFPYCSPTAMAGQMVEVDTRCSQTKPGIRGRVVSWQFVGWWLSVMLSAGLIGLGAPFWFRMYRSVGSLLPRFQASTNAMGKATEGSRPGDTAEPEHPGSSLALLRRFRAASRSGPGPGPAPSSTSSEP